MRSAILILSLSIIFLTSCSKEEGQGGTSVITGKVFVQLYDDANYTVLIGQYYAPEEDVYIIYGDEEIYNDRFRTNYDGSFRFEYLRKGKYTVFAYSEVPESIDPSGVKAIMKVVEITDNDQHIRVEDIVIKKRD